MCITYAKCVQIVKRLYPFEQMNCLNNKYEDDSIHYQQLYFNINGWLLIYVCFINDG
jgi:hypothetical protein